MAAPTDTEFPRTGKMAPNRAVVAAMTNKQSNEDGTLSDEEINWLTRRAEGGFGIVTTAATHIVRVKVGMVRWAFGRPPIARFDPSSGWNNQHGAISLAQIFHGGMRCPQRLTEFNQCPPEKESNK